MKIFTQFLDLVFSLPTIVLSVVIFILLLIFIPAAAYVSAVTKNDFALANYAMQAKQSVEKSGAQIKSMNPKIELLGNGNHCDFQVTFYISSSRSERELQNYLEIQTLPIAKPNSSSPDRRSYVVVNSLEKMPQSQLSTSTSAEVPSEEELDQTVIQPSQYEVTFYDVLYEPDFDFRCM